jgi:hypothetical protein
VWRAVTTLILKINFILLYYPFIPSPEGGVESYIR